MLKKLLLINSFAGFQAYFYPNLYFVYIVFQIIDPY